MIKKRTNMKYGIAIFIVVYCVYITSPVMLSLDSHWSIHTSLSIIHEGNTDLDEYMPEIIKDNYRALEIIDNKYYTIFPVGTSLISVPFVAIADVLFDPVINAFPALENQLKIKLAKRGVIVDQLEIKHVYFIIEMLIAAFYCALCTVMIFLIARKRLSIPFSLLTVFIFAFCTTNWSTSSRALWQHGASMLMLSISVYMLLSIKNKKYLAYLAIPLALSFVIRPTNAIPIFFISLYIFLNHRNVLIRYILMALPIAFLYMAYNLSVYDSILPNYAQPDRVFHLTHFFEALAGNLFSPARGLFIFSPILILSIYGFYFTRNPKNKSIALIMLSSIICHWILISSFPHWHGGHSYGPRLFSDMTPFFMCFIIFAFEAIEQKAQTKKTVILLLTAPLLFFSFYVHYKGAYDFSVHQWNVKPTNIDIDTDRLWHWQDMQMFRSK